MRLIRRIENFFNQRYYLSYLLLFVVALVLFTYIQLDPTFADPDSFYHAKITQILRSQGVITEFPWLSATTLKYNFIDHHFLYHLLLIPFISWFSPLVGLKIATIIFASLSILVFFWFLKQLKVRGAFWYALFLLTINPFVFRINLAKAQAVVLIFLFIWLYLLLNRRYLSLILFSCLYVWLYGGWPLLLILTIVYSIVNWFKSRKETSWLGIRKAKAKINWKSFGLLFSVSAGILAGLFFSPYFPKNLFFYWQQSFKIAVLNYQYIIGVGGEWYPYLLSDLFLIAIPFFVLFAFALGVFFVTDRKQPFNAWLFLVFSFLFLSLTLKSRRNVEYFIPVAVCFSGIAITSFINFLENKKIKVNRLFFIPLVIMLTLSPVFYSDIKSIKESYQTGLSFTKFAEPAQWLKENTPAGSIVFHSDWDEFPLLFYYNDQNYYLVGLDPTFMYEYDKNLHQRWVDITTGKTANDLYPTIKDLFGASYVFVDINQNAEFTKNLANNFYFKKVFENQEAAIYQVL